MTPSGKFAFALVGCGGVGRKRAAAMPEGAELFFASDVDQEKAQAICPMFHDYVPTSAWQSPEVDAVIVATPNAHLYGIAYDAIKAGKHVLVEKPGAISSAQLISLKKIAAHHGKHVHVGYNHRYHPAVAKAHQMVREGVLGPLMHIRGRYGHGGRLGYEKEWRADPKLSGGGELMDQGVHLIDLVHWFMGGEGFAATGHTSGLFWKAPVEDNAFVSLTRQVLRNSGGTQTAWLHASCTEWKNLFSFEIFGQQGKLQIDGLGGSYGTERLTHYAMKPEMGPPDTTIWEYPQPDNSWKLELEDFVKQATTRPNQDSLVDAIRTLEVVEKIYGR
jgi:predicted dehydrogenase